MSKTTFSITRFKNRGGVPTWRVAGWLHGVRVRKNFKTTVEAAAERYLLEIKAAQAATGLRCAATFLTDEQLRESEAGVRRLLGQPHSLTFYLDYALANYREPARPEPLTDCITAYLAMKTREFEQRIISISQLRHIRTNLAVLQRHFPGAAVAELSVPRLTLYLEHGGVSLKTYNNRRGIVSTFLKFALRKDWILANPIEKIPYHRIAHRRGSATTLTAAQAQELMAFVESYEGGRLVPFFALCLFAGIRPCLRTGEILRLRPEHIRLDAGVIHIEPEVSKVREKRTVTIQPNLAAWLQAFPIDDFPIIIPHLRGYRARVAKRFGLSHDVMRHTFISMFVGKSRSVGEASIQAGNSESIIRRHYLDLKNADEAERFFSIMPKGWLQAKAVVVPMPRPAILPAAM